jgi:hypothetical protein
VQIECAEILTKFLYPTSSFNESELIWKIKAQSKSFSNINDVNLSILTRLRMFSSSTINNGESISRINWIKALVFLQENVSKFLGNLGLIRKLNRILLHGVDVSPGCYRTDSMKAGLNDFPSFLDVSSLMNDYAKRLLTIKDPVSQAAYTYQTLVSVHPFVDGNGRTARLAADAILLKHNYLPIAFPSTALGLVIYNPNKDKGKSPHELALEKLLLSATWLNKTLATS